MFTRTYGSIRNKSQRSGVRLLGNWRTVLAAMANPSAGEM